MWARNVTLGRCSVDELDDIVRVALRTSRELAAKEKAKEKQQSSAPAFNTDSFMSAIAASALSVSQLAQSQLLAQQAPAPAPAPTEPTAAEKAWKTAQWRGLTYENNQELLYQTRHFFDWWVD